MGWMNIYTLLASPAGRLRGGPAEGWVGEAGRRRGVVALERGAGGLPLLRQELITSEPVLTASAITRRAPKCAPDMYVWASADLRLSYA
jgi:hypothetical protein